MERSDRVQKDREARRALYSAAHTAAFLQSASPHFTHSPNAPFDFVQAFRANNPVAPDLAEHLSNFRKHIASSTQLTDHPPDAHVIDCRNVFDALYRPAMRQASEARVIVFEEIDDVILRSGIADLFIHYLVRYFEQFVNGKAAADIHNDNLARFQHSLHNADKHILDVSYTTATGTRVGLLVATVSRHPSYRVFTNYNEVGERGGD
ncbi:hypothetical protein EJ07DRAFT_170934 [Lizonia empirigonia]|nr:hypothetical protein EJ07DRAFT_170934 [Lizonia empirigonia]